MLISSLTSSSLAGKFKTVICNDYNQSSHGWIIKKAIASCCWFLIKMQRMVLSPKPHHLLYYVCIRWICELGQYLLIWALTYWASTMQSLSECYKHNRVLSCVSSSLCPDECVSLFVLLKSRVGWLLGPIWQANNWSVWRRNFSM